MSAEGFGLGVLAFLSAYWITGRLCSPTSAFYLLDHPNDRSLHAVPIPRTGGLAILGSVFLCLLMGAVLGWSGIVRWDLAESESARVCLWVTGLTFVIGAVSFWDDRADLPILVRLCAHVGAAAGVTYGAGLTMQAISVPFLGPLPLGWMAIPVTVLFITWMANLYNFMDGMDGFAGGMTVFGFGALSYLSLAGGSQDLAFLALLIAAAAGGFLFFNLPPARIFMGDVGSVPLGFLAGALSVMGVHDKVFDMWVPMLVFSPFIVDATATLLHRLVRGKKVWQAHREHYYQRLVLAGWGHWRTVAVEYVLMLACALSALAYVHVGEPWRLAILAGWIVIYVVLAKGARLVEQRREGLQAEA